VVGQERLVRPSQPEIWIAANTTWNLFNFRRGLIAALLGAGFRVTAFAPEDRYVGHIRALGVRHVHLPLKNSGTNPVKEFFTILKILAILRRDRPALLLTFTPKPNIYASIAAAWLNIPVIANVAGLGRAFVEAGWLKLVSRILYRIALRHPSTVFFQNGEDMALFVSARLVQSDKAALLPGSGVDVQRFRPVDRPLRERFVFLFVGRLLADKGVREFVNAARILRADGQTFECRLLGFIDQGNPTAIAQRELQQWEREGVIRYLGSLDDVATALAEADCVVLPSYYREGCPRSLLEAASMAIPLVAADSIGCREVVKDGENGFLCRPRDATDLAAKMQQMITLSPEQRAEMGRKGRMRVEREFDERLVFSKYMDAIRPLVQR
jgi:glycosyltransferase involved in cell wall biosynthesis